MGHQIRRRNSSGAPAEDDLFQRRPVPGCNYRRFSRLFPARYAGWLAMSNCMSSEAQLHLAELHCYSTKTTPTLSSFSLALIHPFLRSILACFFVCLDWKKSKEIALGSLGKHLYQAGCERLQFRLLILIVSVMSRQPDKQRHLCSQWSQAELLQEKEHSCFGGYVAEYTTCSPEVLSGNFGKSSA